MNKETFKEIQSNLDYDLYEILDATPYGDYYLSIYNEPDTIILVIEDNKGIAAHGINKFSFDLLDIHQLIKLINEVIYYNYNEY